MENYNYKVTYTYTIENTGFLESSNKLKKSSINLAFDSEPNEYQIEDKVKEWLRELEEDGMAGTDFKLEFEEIIKIKQLKVTKGISDFF